MTDRTRLWLAVAVAFLAVVVFVCCCCRRYCCKRQERQVSRSPTHCDPTSLVRYPTLMVVYAGQGHVNPSDDEHREPLHRAREREQSTSGCHGESFSSNPEFIGRANRQLTLSALHITPAHPQHAAKPAPAGNTPSDPESPGVKLTRFNVPEPAEVKRVSMDVLERIASSAVIPMQAVPKPGASGGPVSKGVWDGVRGHTKATIVDSPDSGHSDSETTVIGGPAAPPAPAAATQDAMHATRVGERVRVEGYAAEGTLLFVGPHKTDGRVLCGVTLDAPIGEHDGTLDGERYFQCGEKHGVLVPPPTVTFTSERRAVAGGSPSPAATRKVTRRVKERSAYSLRKSEADLEEADEAKGPLSGRVATAAWAFDAQNEDELAFAVGDKVVVIEAPDGGWWRGRTGEGPAVTEGWFPANHVNLDTEAVKAADRPRSFFSLHVDSYIEVDEESEGTTAPPSPAEHSAGPAAPQPDAAGGAATTAGAKQKKQKKKKPSVIATHRYEAQNEDEISFETGERIEVLQSPSGGWWEGMLPRFGKVGWFPCNHVAPAEPDAPILEDSPDQLLKHIGKYGWKEYTAVSDFSPLNSGQVELVKGDLVVLMQEGDTEKKGWCEVLCRGQHGWVPRPFLSAEPNSQPATEPTSPLEPVAVPAADPTGTSQAEADTTRDTETLEPPSLPGGIRDSSASFMEC